VRTRDSPVPAWTCQRVRRRSSRRPPSWRTDGERNGEWKGAHRWCLIISTASHGRRDREKIKFSPTVAAPRLMNVDSQLEKKFSLRRNYIAGNERNKFAAPFIPETSTAASRPSRARRISTLFPCVVIFLPIKIERSTYLWRLVLVASTRSDASDDSLSLFMAPSFFLLFYFQINTQSMFCPGNLFHFYRRL